MSLMRMKWKDCIVLGLGWKRHLSMGRVKSATETIVVTKRNDIR